MKKIFAILSLLLWQLCIVGSYAQVEQYVCLRVYQYCNTGTNAGDWIYPVNEQYKVAFDDSNSVYISFDDSGNVIAVYGDGGDTIASVPIASYTIDRAVHMVATFSYTASVDTFSTATVDAYGYGTFYSPFTTKIPSSSSFTFYLPGITDTGKTLALTRTARIIPGTVLKPNTAVLVRGTKNGTIKVPFVYGVTPSTLTSKLSGTSFYLPTTCDALSGKTIFTLGKAKNYNRFGFFRFTGTELKPNKAFLIR